MESAQEDDIMWGSKQVAEFIGVGYPTLDHWIRSGLLSCLSPSDGTGNRRSWSAGDVVRAAAVQRLRQGGYSLQAIRKSGILNRLTDEAIANPLPTMVNARCVCPQCGQAHDPKLINGDIIGAIRDKVRRIQNGT